MTADDRRLQGVPVFRDFGHSLSIDVTDMVLPDPKNEKCRACEGAASFNRAGDQSIWRPAPRSSWIPPVPTTAGRQPYPAYPRDPGASSHRHVASPWIPTFGVLAYA